MGNVVMPMQHSRRYYHDDKFSEKNPRIYIEGWNLIFSIIFTVKKKIIEIVLESHCTNLHCSTRIQHKADPENM